MSDVEGGVKGRGEVTEKSDYERGGESSSGKFSGHRLGRERAVRRGTLGEGHRGGKTGSLTM